MTARARAHRSSPRSVRPNPRRQVILALVAVAAIGVGYGVGLVVRPDPPIGSGPEQHAEAWYKRQAPPPMMVTAPPLPLLPDTDHTASVGSGAPRAYEEPLPDTVYAPSDVASSSNTDGGGAHFGGPAAAVPTTLLPAAGVDTAEPPAWRRYAVAVPASRDRPRIAVVIDDLGIDRRRTAAAIALPAPLTLSFLTYADDLTEQTRVARAAGHELLVHVGMAPLSETVDPGPNVLDASIDADELRRRLRWGLDRFHGYVGINNHMGSHFTSDPDGMAVVMEELKARGLLFLDSRTTPETVGPRLAREQSVPLVERNVFLDNVGEVDAVNARLAEAEEMARRYGKAVAIGHPRAATLEALRAWLPAVRERGFDLVPVSALAEAPDVFVSRGETR